MVSDKKYEEEDYDAWQNEYESFGSIMLPL